MGKVKSSICWPNAPDRSSAANQMLADAYFKHHSPYYHTPPRHKYNVVGDRVEECKTVTVHAFEMSDVDDPDLHAAKPLYDWEQSDLGQWVMKNAADTPTWHRVADSLTYGYKYVITAKFMGPSLTEWLLRYGSK